jgi:hypothetical protein
MNDGFFTEGDRVIAVEHDPETLELLADGKTCPATVERTGGIYVRARLMTGQLWAFYQRAGWGATPEVSHWRLLPDATAAGEGEQ